MGEILSIDDKARELIVLFDDDRCAIYNFNELRQLEHCYAITVHKSQGSEFPIVVIPVFMGGQKLMTRNLLYTAMTRAKELLVFVGNMGSIEYMVRNLNKKERHSGLKLMLEEEYI